MSDLDSAVSGDVEHEEDVQPNVYRAPEVCLKAPWSYRIGIWNVGRLHFHAGSKCPNIRVGPVEGPSQRARGSGRSAEGARGEGCYQAKSQLELECLRRESEVRVAAVLSAAAGAPQAQAQRPRAQMGGDDELEGEIPPC